MNLEILKPYRVTKGNTDGSIVDGDLIWMGSQGFLNIATGNGFFSPDELVPEIMDFEAKPNNEYFVDTIINSVGTTEILRRKADVLKIMER